MTTKTTNLIKYVSTLAGNHEYRILSNEGGFADGIGSAAWFNFPSQIAIDTAGDLYVADTGNHRIRKVTPAGKVSTLAGGEEGFADGQGSAAQFDTPCDIAIDTAGNLYVADSWNDRIRKVTPAGEVSTLAGGEGGFADGQGSAARFDHPVGIAIDAEGNLYVADGGNHRIRKVTPTGEVTTLAGGKRGFADGQGSAARFDHPVGIAIDASGNLYVADTGNHRIRKVTPAGEVSTLAGDEEGFADGTGSAARFDGLSGIVVDASDNLYVTSNDCIRKVTPEGEVSTLVGRYSSLLRFGAVGDFADGQESDARFYRPDGIVIDAAGNLYVADSGNHRIRKIEFRRSSPFPHKAVVPDGVPFVSTLADGEEVPADGTGGTAARFDRPVGIAIDASGNLYVADHFNHCIRKVTPKGEVSIFAGGEEGFADGQGSAAQFNKPFGIAIDAAGNLFVTDSENHRIRKVTPKGEASTLAGSESGFADGRGSAARFNLPGGIAIGAGGNLYVADGFNHRIRKVTLEGEVTTLAGDEEGFADGTGSAARFRYPSGVAIDASGNLYVADLRNHRIRKVTQAGEVSTLAGGVGGFADGSAAQFAAPIGITIDASGNLYVADVGNHRIRKIEFRRP